MSIPDNLLLKEKNFLLNIDYKKNIIAKRYLSNDNKNNMHKLKTEENILKKLCSHTTFTFKELNYIDDKIVLILNLKNSQKIYPLDEKSNMPYCDELINMLIKISTLIKNLHDKNILHGSVTSSTIFYNEKEQFFITDFSNSIKLSKDILYVHFSYFNNLNVEYLSPEQNGKINKNVDLRSDLYSLGIVLYELLTGISPFRRDNQLDSLYSNLTATPKPIHEINKLIPKELSLIVLKLLEKNLSRRYQSIYGLLKDLETISNKQLSNFKVAQYDISNKFQISQKIYGREKEVETLLNIYKDVSNGGFKTIFINGYSGIGKTSLINQIQKQILLTNAFFVSGKFELYSDFIPYFAISQAFENFAKKLLTKTDKELLYWKDIILNAVGNNGQILVEIIPLLKEIIGEQTPVDKLDAQESQNRFNNIFLKFINAIATKDHPLILFIDDLQWVDYATFKLFDLFIDNEYGKYFLILGAYRNNEIDDKHLLNKIISKDNLEILHLKSLTKNNLSEFIQDSFFWKNSQAKELVEEIFVKTDANPYFFIQFLMNLYQKELIYFDNKSVSWKYDIKKVKKESSTNNVTNFMIDKISKFEIQLLKPLQVASCLGATFDINILSKILNINIEKLFEKLNRFIHLGFLTPINNSKTLIKFSHDQVQQAVYSTIDEKEITKLHYKISEILLDTYKDSIDKNCFKIVLHLNQSLNLINDTNKKIKVAKLNLTSGKKAKNSAAYASSLGYLNISRNILESLNEKEYYDLYLNISLEYIESLFLVGEYDEANQKVKKLFSFIENKNDEIALRRILIVQYTRFGELDSAIEQALYTLKLLDISIKKDLTVDDVGKEISDVQELVKENPFSKIYTLKKIENKNILKIMDILMEMQPCTYNSGSLIFPITILRLLKLTIIHGNSDLSYYIYMMYALMNTKVLKDYDMAYQASMYASIIRKNGILPILEGRFDMMNSNFIMSWFRDVKEASKLRDKAFQECLNVGDYYWGIHAYIFGFYGDLLACSNIDELLKKTQRTADISKKIDQPSQHYLCSLQINFLNVLKGELSTNNSLSHIPNFEENALKNFEDHNYMCGKYDRIIARLLISYFFEDYQKGLNISLPKNLDPSSIDEGIFHEAFYKIFNVLSIYALKLENKILSKDKNRYDQFLQETKSIIKTWNKNAPMNFNAPYYLIKAEKAQLQGKIKKAMYYYEKSINKAKENSLLIYEAIANERYAHFWLKQNNKLISNIYFKNAINIYILWGALKKSDFLISKYNVSITNENICKNIDIEAIIKTSNTISKEVKLEKLIHNILEIVLKLSAGQNILIFLKDKNKFNLSAQMKEDKFISYLNNPHTDISPESILTYVERTKELLLINEVQDNELFSNDTYLKQYSTQSLVCIPLQINNEVKAIIYIESLKDKNIFNNSQIDTLKLLSSQMIIAIENSFFYEKLENKIKDRTLHLKEANYKLEKLIQIDSLTKVYNRHYLDKYLAKTWRESIDKKTPISIIMIDIDYFKNYNDTYGHIAGDNCLTTVAQTLNDSLKRASDFFARYGGEEFIAIINDDIKGAENLAEVFRLKVQDLGLEHTPSEKGIVTISLGVASISPTAKMDSKSLIQLADEALYKSKESGRNKTSIVDLK